MFDPQRHMEAYLTQARGQGLRIRYGLDSPGHNDYLSGLTEFATRTDAAMLGSAEADLGYEHRPVRDCEQLELGDVGTRCCTPRGKRRSISACWSTTGMIAATGRVPVHSVLGGMTAWAAAHYPLRSERWSKRAARGADPDPGAISEEGGPDRDPARPARLLLVSGEG